MVVFLHPGISGILRAELVIIDDIGLMTVVTDAAEGLHPVLEAAYKKMLRGDRLQSTQPATTNSAQTLAAVNGTATAERLFHHYHVGQTNGHCIRLS